MKFYLPTIGLTVINLGLLIFLLVARVGPTTAVEVVPVLRGKALEILDDDGRMRAQITLIPASVGLDGQPYQDTVLFRLIDPNGRPGVKIGTSVEGGGISLAGDSETSEWSGVQILAEGKESSIILTNRDGTAETITP